jgi:pyrimidine deaminase RibD-like protein
MLNRKSDSPLKVSKFIKLAYEQAKINLGSTGPNPSVGCVVEKNG